MLATLILVGGVGTRLAPVIGPDLPKALAPVFEHPFLWYLLDWLARQGVGQVVLATGHGGRHLRAAVEDMTPPGMEVDCCEETQPLGTGGAVRHALQRMRADPFLVLNGDSILLAPLEPFAVFHQARGALASLLLAKVSDAARYGAVELGQTGEV